MPARPALQGRRQCRPSMRVSIVTTESDAPAPISCSVAVPTARMRVRPVVPRPPPVPPLGARVRRDHGVRRRRRRSHLHDSLPCSRQTRTRRRRTQGRWWRSSSARALFTFYLSSLGSQYKFTFFRDGGSRPRGNDSAGSRRLFSKGLP
uniref:Predicted protein n=1 Tax=Hordeum vulgare subsp. vulgare TaxID=112509 RepID=F2CQ42_HORVV|nr:predicted protein [Hordeum vulgare subsp. vulgare]